MKPVFYLLLSVLVASFSGIFIKLSSLPPTTIAFYRVFIASLLFFLVKRRVGLFSLKKEMLSLIAGFFLAMHFFFWVSAFNHTTVAGAVIPLTLQPVLTGLLSWLIYGERISPFRIVTGSTVVTGVVLALAGKEGFSGVSRGDLLAVVGVVFFCGYLVLGRYLNRAMGSMEFSLRTHALASAVLAFLVPSFGVVETKEWFILIGLGVGCSFLGYLFINLSLRYFSSSVVSVVLVGEPVLSVLWSFLLLGEAVTFFEAIGFIVSVIGLVLFILKT
ncbi:DMT family transporter [Thermotoga sp. 38H-to]|uniref:DMT family transporter n=1 Tax=Thermotoga sp. 38H-to TaxID=1755812 RepID=UPI00054278EA|nr:DMT family transporter [Thermotoga sp. 38H-to]KAF2960704.1 hypothetical protein AS158_03370 [Thermotoga sp. 38H-to]KHC92299.1 hypothetical protein Mc24_02683 [Thermotoga sp. Mc24]